MPMLYRRLIERMTEMMRKEWGFVKAEVETAIAFFRGNTSKLYVMPLVRHFL